MTAEKGAGRSLELGMTQHVPGVFPPPLTSPVQASVFSSGNKGPEGAFGRQMLTAVLANPLQILFQVAM